MGIHSKKIVLFYLNFNYLRMENRSHLEDTCNNKMTSDILLVPINGSVYFICIIHNFALREYFILFWENYQRT
jgi:hypothetical protein